MTSTMTTQELLQLMAARRHAEDGTGRMIRQNAGLSMREVAEALNTTESRLARWETGQVRPRGAVGVKWVALLEELARHTKNVAA